MIITMFDKNPKLVYKNIKAFLEGYDSEDHVLFDNDFLSRLNDNINKTFQGKFINIDFTSRYSMFTYITTKEQKSVLYPNYRTLMLFCESKQRKNMPKICNVKLLHNNTIYYHQIKLFAEPIFFDPIKEKGIYRWTYECPYQFNLNIEQSY